MGRREFLSTGPLISRETDAEDITSHTALEEHTENVLAFLLQNNLGQEFHKTVFILGTLILRPIRLLRGHVGVY